MNGYDYILAALYHIRGRFSDLRPFMHLLPFDARELPYSAHDVAVAIDQAHVQIIRRDNISESTVLELLIDEELQRVKHCILDSSIAAEIDRRKDIRACLAQTFEEAKTILAKHNISIGKHTAVHIVDIFPSPYEDREYAVMVADSGDYDAYDIPQGVYFLERYLRPFYSEYLACHEIVHIALGTLSPDLIAHGLEEGIAEVLGAYCIATQILGADMTQNLFIYNRLGGESHPLWDQYLDFTRAASLIYRKVGDEGLFELVRLGRQGVKNAEKAILSQNIKQLSVDGVPPSQDMQDRLDFLLNSFPRYSVVSPLAFYIAKFVRPGMSVRELAALTRCSYDDVMKGLTELADDYSLLSLRKDGSVVIWSDVELYYRTDVLRYRVS